MFCLHIFRKSPINIAQDRITNTVDAGFLRFCPELTFVLMSLCFSTGIRLVWFDYGPQFQFHFSFWILSRTEYLKGLSNKNNFKLYQLPLKHLIFYTGENSICFLAFSSELGFWESIDLRIEKPKGAGLYSYSECLCVFCAQLYLFKWLIIAGEGNSPFVISFFLCLVSEQPQHGNKLQLALMRLNTCFVCITMGPDIFAWQLFLIWFGLILF